MRCDAVDLSLAHAAAQQACISTLCGNGINTESCNFDCTAPMCGDGIANLAAGEICDSKGEDTATCNSAGPLQCQLPTCGDGHVNLAAGEVCEVEDGKDSQICDAKACNEPACGDGYINTAHTNPALRPGGQTEQCDDGVDDPTTENIIEGNSDNTLGSCLSNCLCPCGNGLLEDSEDKLPEGCKNESRIEQCDNGASNSNDPNAECRPNCRPSDCGDGIVDKMPAQGKLVEACDNGESNSELPNAECRLNCQFDRCGDGVIDDAPPDRDAEECELDTEKKPIGCEDPSKPNCTTNLPVESGDPPPCICY